MRIAARMALESLGARLSSPSSGQSNVAHRGDFHGSNVVLRSLSRTGFEAESTADYPAGSLVRLRLPVSGVAIARINDCGGGRLWGEFVNPLAEARLARTLGASFAG